MTYVLAIKKQNAFACTFTMWAQPLQGLHAFKNTKFAHIFYQTADNSCNQSTETLWAYKHKCLNFPEYLNFSQKTTCGGSDKMLLIRQLIQSFFNYQTNLKFKCFHIEPSAFLLHNIALVMHTEISLKCRDVPGTIFYRVPSTGY